MSKISQIILFLIFAVHSFSRNLQTVYSVIVIGSGASGIGASVALASKNVDHIILEARNRFGGRTYATTMSGVNVDLGASFVHNPELNNAINTYVNFLNWGEVLANFSSAVDIDQNGQPSVNQTNAANILSAFQDYASSQVSNGIDQDLKTVWDSYVTNQGSGLPAADLNRAYFQVYLEGDLNGADLNTVSTIAYSSQSGQSKYDYLPAISYAALIQQIYTKYCKNAQIIYNQVVTNIDYSGSIVKITTAGGQIYYANKVINTIPLGVLQNGDVTFSPSLPAAYQTAISSIGFGIFNKIIVTLNDTFWSDTSTTRIVDLTAPPGSNSSFPEFYVAPTSPQVLLFFLAGNHSKTLNLKTDAQIISQLETYITSYTNKTINVTNYIITRWQQDIYSRGSYSYYKVGTTVNHFNTLMTNINNKLWFAGEHVHPNQSSNAHGAFQSGLWAGQGAALFDAWHLVTALWLVVLLLAM